MTTPAFTSHATWLGYIQPTGLVVSPPALVAAGCALPSDAAERQARLVALTPTGILGDLPSFLVDLLEWQSSDLVPGTSLPDLEVALTEYGDVLSPDWAVPKPDGEEGWQMLVVRVPGDTDLDALPHETGTGWRATPQARMERLLREREIPVGLLANDLGLRLVYAPRGESSGWMTFKLADLRTVAGRPLLGALVMLLGTERLFVVSPNKRLPAVLKESRKYQNEVSTRLADQVLGALEDLLRGFELADADRKGDLLRAAVAADPQHVYGGLISVLLRLVFLLYAEERGLMPGDPVYVRHYSVAGLFEKLRADAGRHPDTMDQRYGAWARLLSLFRLVYAGGGDAGLHLPSRKGVLFDPEIHPFLEGRPWGRIIDEPSNIQVPRVPDGAVWRVLEKLLLLDGERLSYRALDVEQIGSVYEAMMGYELKRAFAPSVAVRPKRVVVSLNRVLEAKDRAKILAEEAECALTGKALDALKAARRPEDVVAVLGRKAVDGRVIPEGGLYLQPGEERRRSGSHYTPRSLTEPIVRTTLRPVLEALGTRPTPEQILALKVCDPAMGSGAFLVEACRQLGDALVEAWAMHRCTPEIPPDEDPLLHARRLVAQRCLYGVDKNPFAVNLAKLSLWLVTLAKDHPFTFLDHALKNGDSLVGLTKRQIGAFDWKPEDTEMPALLAWMQKQTAAVLAHRAEIHAAGDRDDDARRLAWKDAEDDLEPARIAGDLCIAAFFGAEKEKAREELRQRYKGLLARWRESLLPPAGEGGRRPDEGVGAEIVGIRDGLRKGERPLVPFHWEVEFPEVFERVDPGFDAVVGNPPYADTENIAVTNGAKYPEYLRMFYPESGGKADVVAFFWRRSFHMARRMGAVGLITTKTVAQGDTRRSGLAWIVRNGGIIYSVVRRLVWPGVASVIASIVHLSRRAYQGAKFLDGQLVPEISAFLLPNSHSADPLILRSSSGIAFLGCKPSGMGFIVDDTDARCIPTSKLRAALADDPLSERVVFDYLIGSDLNASPTLAPRRRILHFGERSEPEVTRYWGAFHLVEEYVKPTSTRNNWWQFARQAKDLTERLAAHSEVVVVAETSDTLAFAVYRTDIVFSDRVVVFAHKPALMFPLLQSRVHETWVRVFTASFKDDVKYVPSSCFETFPFPSNLTSNPELEAVGKQYHDFRAALMIRNNQGLTATYNRFHDPDETNPEILELRRLHTIMDRAVLDAYGWTDISTDCVFRLDYEEPEDEDAEEAGKKRRKKKPWRLRWPEAVHDEVLARLLALNLQRAEEERMMAAPKDKKPPKPLKSSSRKPASKALHPGPSLFGPEKE